MWSIFFNFLVFVCLSLSYIDFFYPGFFLCFYHDRFILNEISQLEPILVSLLIYQEATVVSLTCEFVDVSASD